jgi:Fe-S cluster biosynthesis and repair protein YggX
MGCWGWCATAWRGGKSFKKLTKIDWDGWKTPQVMKITLNDLDHR